MIQIFEIRKVNSNPLRGHATPRCSGLPGLITSTMPFGEISLVHPPFNLSPAAASSRKRKIVRSHRLLGGDMGCRRAGS